MKSVLKRAFTGIILLILLYGIIFGSRLSLFIMVLVISSIGIFELLTAMSLDRKTLFFATILSNILIQYFAYQQDTTGIISAYALTILGLFIVFTFSSRLETIEMFSSMLALLYISLLLSFLLLFPVDKQIYILLVFLGSWGSDTFAYIFGMLFGKHTLAPKISPKKTIEGSVGGMLASIVLALVLRPLLFPELGILKLAFAMIITSIIGQTGDLFASKIKRKYDIKDFGWILMGHGGILDRFDSVIFASPTVWVLLQIL